MLRNVFAKALLIPTLALVTLAAWPSTSQAQFKQGDWELTLGGSGSNNRQFTAGGGGVSGSIGYFFTKEIEFAFRQNANYSSNGNTDQFIGDSRVAADYHFEFGKFVPFAGANFGYSYGNRGFQDTFEVAPEAGAKYFLNSTTFLFGLAEYEIFFRSGHGATFNRGSFVYSLGLGLRF
jgi:hypothetical protein